MGARPVDSRVLGFSAWTRLKHRLPYRLRPWCSRVEARVFGRRGLKVWVDGTPLRVAVDAAPVPSTSADHLEEHELMASVLRSVGPGDQFLDAGSHIGLYALAAAVRVGPRGRVVAFEPTPATLEKLRRNLSLNAAGERVDVEPIALSDRPGTVEFLTTGSSMMNSIFTGVPPGHTRPAVPESRISVRTDNLDRFFREGRATVAKIDTEGHEIVVLRGAPRLMASQARIFVELHPWAWGGDAGTWEELQALCRAAGRTIRLLGGGELMAPAHRRVELVKSRS
jgi:FkbM family methyltransferase